MEKYECAFEPEEKQRAFDMIADLYYQRNFGSTSKSDMETLLFSIFLEHLLCTGQPYDDYTVSLQLGITESRVRALKERKQLKYPHKYIWQEAFAKIAKNAKYDKTAKTVKLTIEDVNLLKEVRHFVRVNGWYDEMTLNPRLFQCKLDCYLMICYRLDEGERYLSEEDRKALRKLAENEDERGPIEKILDGDVRSGLHELVFHGTETALCSVLEKLPFGKIGSGIVKDYLHWKKKEAAK